MQYAKEEHIAVLRTAHFSIQEGIVCIQFLFCTSISHLILQKKYVIGKVKMNFVDSAAHCESLGGNLALPESAEENQQILDKLGNSTKLLLVLCLFLAPESCNT